MTKNPLRFGDVLILGVLLCLAGVSIGCALLSKTAGVEQKLADVRSLSYAAASLGTSQALLENESWRPQFVSAYVQLDQLVSQKIVTGDLLRKILASLPVKELKGERARIAIESMTLLYDSTVGDKVNIEAQPYVMAAADGISRGMKVALGL